MCECSDPACRSRIHLTRLEYEAVRGYPTRFAIATDHENPEVDQLVSEGRPLHRRAEDRRPRGAHRPRDGPPPPRRRLGARPSSGRRSVWSLGERSPYAVRAADRHERGPVRSRRRRAAARRELRDPGGLRARRPRRRGVDGDRTPRDRPARSAGGVGRGRSERSRARLPGGDLAGRVRRHRGGPPAPARRRRRARTRSTRSRRSRAGRPGSRRGAGRRPCVRSPRTSPGGSTRTSTSAASLVPSTRGRAGSRRSTSTRTSTRSSRTRPNPTWCSPRAPSGSR